MHAGDARRPCRPACRLLGRVPALAARSDARCAQIKTADHSQPLNVTEERLFAAHTEVTARQITGLNKRISCDIVERLLAAHNGVMVRQITGINASVVTSAECQRES